MRMTTCGACQKPMSKDASLCPDYMCMFPARWNLGNCRECKAPLPRDHHRVVRTSVSQGITTTNGNVHSTSSVMRYVQHLPCPKCGSKRPLRQLEDTVLGKSIPLLPIFILGIAFIWGLASDHPTRIDRIFPIRISALGMKAGTPEEWWVSFIIIAFLFYVTSYGAVRVFGRATRP